MNLKHNIYYFSNIEYEFLRQRPQQLFDAWNNLHSKRYNVFYVETFQKLFSSRKSPTPGVLKTDFYYSFSKLGLNFLNIINKYFIRKLILNNKSVNNVAITCNSLLEPYLTRDLFKVICYDHLDSLDVHTGNQNHNLIITMHDRLLEKSDIVFVTADKLKQEIKTKYPNKTVVMVTNGVDCDFFNRRKNCSTEITDFVKGNRPVVGYIGAIWSWIDVELVHKAARMSPEMDYVMVGPLKNNEALIADKPENVLYLGVKPYELVPTYLNLFDVAIIPFKRSDISESTDPIKLYEYFALGKPVVTTSMRQMVKFNDGALLRVANEPDAFVNAIRSFITSDSHENRIRRIELAQQNSWHNKASIMIEAIEHHMSTR